MADTPVSIFVVYARKDEALMQDLENHLEPLRLSPLIHSWHRGCIESNREWAKAIKQNLESAQIILLLISPGFIASGYCYDVELTKAFERHRTGVACVIPVILRSCWWRRVPISDMKLGDLQALPEDGKPISKWQDPKQAFDSITAGVIDKIQQLQRIIKTADAQRQQVSITLRELSAQRDREIQDALARHKKRRVELEVSTAAELQALQAKRLAELEENRQRLRKAEMRSVQESDDSSCD